MASNPNVSPSIQLSLESFNQFGENASFIHELYTHYKADPSAVGTEWINFFTDLESSLSSSVSSSAPTQQVVTTEVSLELVKKQAEVSRLIDTYRSIGHFGAKINPLSKGIVQRGEKDELALSSFSLSSTDMATPFFTHGLMAEGTATLEEIYSKLLDTYNSSVGFEYMHLTEFQEREFLRSKIEDLGKKNYSLEERKLILKSISDAESLEAMLHKRFVGAKRFSLEGSETASATLVFALEALSKHGAKKARIGMAHRGRLSTLVNICGKPLENLICEFEDRTWATENGFGDVKYHLGHSKTHQTATGDAIDVCLAVNPSHLEFVNAVVSGQVRADQDLEFNGNRKASCAILVHGDAAFIGQGVVFETLNFTGTKGYDIGGTVHLVINNQIGFTATDDESRGTTYCTDLAKGINAPVFHVNGEDPESCVWAMELACEFRQKFGRDVIIDLVCYRKYGHNEGDDPTFTQPAMYEEIKAKSLISSQYISWLKNNGVDLQSELASFKEEYQANFELASEKSKQVKDVNKITVEPQEYLTDTAVPKEKLLKIATASVTLPDGYAAHTKLFNLLKKRATAVEAGSGIEWGVAEGLAFGSLLSEGVNIRISGQDAIRGTFSHRHAYLDSTDQSTSYAPLSTIKQNNNQLFDVYNSVLSECGVLGFEYGYTNVANNSLIIWEGQFGDFANGAQVIIDQFMAAGEVKWGQLSNVFLLLPHGFEGQGPEHSSARLERFLQLAADENMSIYYPSNGAQYFHILRRHVYAKVKRPAIVMSPKSLLRLPDAAVTTEQLASGTFEPVISEVIGDSKKATTTICLTGKLYYEVVAALKNASLSAKVVRVEQFYPYPVAELKAALSKSKNVIWAQEEPKNQGAWNFISELMNEHLDIQPKYVGRPRTATTACGSGKRHAAEQKKIIDEIISIVSK
jgi:2-oxoglutarate dehydrogenase E1 component